MVAVEFIDPARGQPAPEFSEGVQSRAPKRGLIQRTCGFWSNVMGFLYPLTSTDVVFNEGLKIPEAATLGSLRIKSGEWLFV
jgi:4-aminobutyrate aminotransferase